MGRRHSDMKQGKALGLEPVGTHLEMCSRNNRPKILNSAESNSNQNPIFRAPGNVLNVAKELSSGRSNPLP